MTMAWLYRTEAKGIQGYVLATDKLREMAGASALVESLSDGVELLLKEITGGAPNRVEKVASAAGNAMLKFSDEHDLRRFRATWPLRVARACPGLRVIQVWTQLTEDGLDSALERLSDLARDEAARPSLELPAAGPWVARAGRTGRPAVVVKDRWIRRDGRVDAATRAKLECVRGNLEDGQDEARDVLGKKLLPDGAPPLALTHDELGKGYVGVLHADGNGVGALLVNGKVPADKYGAFSKGLTDATLEAARVAVADLWGQVQKRAEDKKERLPEKLPVRPIVLGGDDFTVVVKARYAVRFAAVFLRSFEETTRRHLTSVLGRGLTAAAGIALVKSSFPFHQAYELAEGLCSAAKEPRTPDALWPKEATPSRVLFHRVTTSALRDWGDIVRKELSAGPKNEKKRWKLAAGPWTLDELAKLSRLVQALGRVPRGAIRGWLGLVLEAFPRSNAHWLRVREVLGLKAREELDAALTALEVDPGTLWREHEDPEGKRASENPEEDHRRWTTPISEAVIWRGLDPTGSVRSNVRKLDAAPQEVPA